MTRDRNKFLSLREVKVGNFTLGNNDSRRITGEGTICLDDGRIMTQNALLVEIPKHNILSVGQMVDQWYDLTFNSKLVEIRKVDLEGLVANSIRSPNNAYVLNKIRRKKISYMGVTCLITHKEKKKEIATN